MPLNMKRKGQISTIEVGVGLFVWNEAKAASGITAFPVSKHLKRKKELQHSDRIFSNPWMVPWLCNRAMLSRDFDLEIGMEATPMCFKFIFVCFVHG